MQDLIYEPAIADPGYAPGLILAHGAGAGSGSPFMSPEPG